MASFNFVLALIVFMALHVGSESSRVILKEFEFLNDQNTNIFSEEGNVRSLFIEKSLVFKASVNGSPLSIKLFPADYDPIADDAIAEIGGKSIDIGSGSEHMSRTFLDESFRSVLTVSINGHVTGRLYFNGETTSVNSIQEGEDPDSIVLELERSNYHNHVYEESSANTKRLRSDSNSNHELVDQNFRNLLSIPKWKKDCVKSPKVLNIGIIIGSSLAKNKFSNKLKKINNWLGHVIAEANIVYHPMNIVLRLQRLIVWDKEDPLDNKECYWKVHQQYYLLSRKFKPDPKPNKPVGFWHLFDDCYPAGDSHGGMASLSALCGDRAVSVSRVRDSSAWALFAHEAAHILGLHHHSAEGIMGDGDSSLDGQIQFNEDSVSDTACSFISEKAETCDAFESSTCGNGVVEPGEECECKNGKNCKCCKNCRLNVEKDAVCSETDQCCTKECQYATADTDCVTGNGRNGYCGQYGRCTKSNCDIYSDSFEGMCGHYKDNDCKIKCKPIDKKSCDDLTGYQPNDIMNVLDGSLCRRNDKSIGTCSRGECK